MDEQMMAANADVAESAAPEGVADPSTAGNSTAQREYSTSEGHVQQDVTQTQAFAYRLKEATEKARQEARDAYIAEQGYVWNGRQITSETQYKKALAEKEAYDRYQAQGLPEDIIQQLSKVNELERWRNETTQREQRQKYEAAMNTRRTDMFRSFLSDFPEYNSEPAWKTIPPEVFNDAKKWIETGGQDGRRLSDAMANHLYRQSVKQYQTQQTNAANAGASTGSVKGQGRPNIGFISREVYEQNKGDQNWMMKNYEILNHSYGRW